MELLFKEQILGTIHNVSKESYWNYGLFKKAKIYNSFAPLFRDLVCEDGFDDTKYDEDYLDDQNWYISLSGEKIGICLPAIYDDGEISFRYR